MALLGLLLLLAGAAVMACVLLAAANGTAVQLSLLDQATRTTSARGVFVLGVVAGVIALLGLRLMTAGAARARVRRADQRRTRKQTRAEQESLRERNAELERQLSAAREEDRRRVSRGSGSPTGAAAPAATAAAGAGGPAARVDDRAAADMPPRHGAGAPAADPYPDEPIRTGPSAPAGAPAYAGTTSARPANRVDQRADRGVGEGDGAGLRSLFGRHRRN